METDVPRPAAGGDQVLLKLVWVAAGLLAAAGVWVRFRGLHWQSYWTDESFSVLQSMTSWAHVIDVGRTEIHPPLFALMLHAWELVGGPGPVWTRSLTALLGSLGVLVSYLGLRRSGLDPLARALVVAITATSGFAIVYAQEVRPYALLWLAAVGLTAATLQLALRPERLPRHWLAWVLWGALASATHLFGALLVAVTSAVLFVARRAWGEWMSWALSTLGGLAPQLAWLAYGLTVPGFAGGTGWIDPPTLVSLGQLLTTTFAFSNLTMLMDGFWWSSPWLLVALIGIGVVAATSRAVPGRDPEGGASSDRAASWRAVLVLAAVTLLMVSAVFALSQVVHVWTLRNMIVIAPSLTWLAVCLPVALADAPWARWTIALATTATLTVTLASVATGLEPKYKTDYAGAMEYLAEVRAEVRDAQFLVSTENPDAWMLSADLPQTPEYLDWLLGDAVLVPKERFSSVLKPVDGVSVYVWYRSTDPSKASGRVDAMLDRLGRDQCVEIPIQGIAVVRCERGV